MTPWSTDSIPSQTGRTVIITGATSGIGLAAAAKVLAGKGARVVMAVRNQAKAAEAVARIGGAAEVRQLDLADLDSVRAFADDWTDPIDLLINNAGVMAVPLSRTARGLRAAVRHQPPGPLRPDQPAAAHRSPTGWSASAPAPTGWGSIDLTDLNWERRRYKQWPAYGQSKLANLLVRAGAGAAADRGRLAVRAVAAHPGFARTNLQGHSGNAWADRATLWSPR